MVEAGCEIVRIAVPDDDAAAAMYKIRKRTNVPIVADIHFHYKLALKALDAGIDKLRINPGNIGHIDRVREVVLHARTPLAHPRLLERAPPPARAAPG